MKISLPETLIKDVRLWRRHLHMYPEPSFEEIQTMEFVSQILSKNEIVHHKGVAGTGVVALIASSKHSANSPCLALRADLDALPIQELNEVSYRSKNKGWMHACGHDVHTSILLGVAVYLQSNREKLKRPVKLIFQPGEEKNPGGATLMIEAGILDNPIVEELVALHVYPELQVGKVGLKQGLYMASSDEIHVEVEGIGGHGALVERFINPIEIGISWMETCKHKIALACPHEVPHVLTFGRFEALGSTNVVSNTAIIKGTFRTMNEAFRTEAKKILHREAEIIAKKFGGKIHLNLSEGYPFLKNDPDLTQRVSGILSRELGQENIEKLPLRMTAEDFSFYGQHRPICFFRLGTGNTQKGIVHAVHHPNFDIDEHALEIGIRSMVAIALS